MKYIVLEALKEVKPGYLSGEQLSRRLEVSRTAVWKYINELKLEGYEIEASSRKGYRLLSEPDILDARLLSADLATSVVGSKILYFDEVDSTNIRAKELAGNTPDGTVILAGRQSAGRGRLGRKWESDDGGGIYMSVILKPEIPPEEVQLITLAASVAIVSAIKDAAGIDAGIKWPNDIILDGRKVCGILTEMSSEMERVNYVVLGIGINFSQELGDFPEELRNKAVSISEYMEEKGLKPCKKAELVRSILVRLDEVYRMLLEGRKNDIIATWKNMSVTIGRDVAVSGREVSYTGKALDITEDGRLVVLCENGILKEIISGEVSVRGLLGYV